MKWPTRGRMSGEPFEVVSESSISICRSSLEQLKYSLWHSESLSVEYANLEESDFNDPQLIIAAIFDSKVFCYDVVTKAIKVSRTFYSLEPHLTGVAFRSAARTRFHSRLRRIGID